MLFAAHHSCGRVLCPPSGNGGVFPPHVKACGPSQRRELTGSPRPIAPGKGPARDGSHRAAGAFSVVGWGLVRWPLTARAENNRRDDDAGGGCRTGRDAKRYNPYVYADDQAGSDHQHDERNPDVVSPPAVFERPFPDRIGGVGELPTWTLGGKTNPEQKKQRPNQHASAGLPSHQNRSHARCHHEHGHRQYHLDQAEKAQIRDVTQSTRPPHVSMIRRSDTLGSVRRRIYFSPGRMMPRMMTPWANKKTMSVGKATKARAAIMTAFGATFCNWYTKTIKVHTFWSWATRKA